MELPQEIGQILMLLTRDFQRRLDHDLEQRSIEGIGSRHRSVFLHLARFGPSRSVDLAAAAGIRPQSMMAIVNELLELGLIARRPDPSDSRAKLIEFTDRGQQLIDELSESTTAVWQHYAQLTSDTQLRQTFNGLKQLLTAVRQDEGDDL
jgi:DNA-binding MarR family transcriptional regulator